MTNPRASRKKVNYRRRVEARLRALFEYFRNAKIRLEHMPQTRGGTDDPKHAQYAYLDSVILASSYLDALAVFRYGQGRQGFIQFLQNYSNAEQQRWYRRISSLYLDQPPLDDTGNLQKRLSGSDLKRIRRILYGNAVANSGSDFSLDEAARRLDQASVQMPKELLNCFSYAAYFYERYRCHGVHNVQPPAPGVSSVAKPYYEPRRRPKFLIFPRQFILDTLTACIDNFEKEALEKLKGGPPPATADDYRWLKERFGLKSTFIETVCAYYRPGSKPRVPAAPRGSS